MRRLVRTAVMQLRAGRGDAPAPSTSSFGLLLGADVEWDGWSRSAASQSALRP